MALLCSIWKYAKYDLLFPLHQNDNDMLQPKIYQLPLAENKFKMTSRVLRIIYTNNKLNILHKVDVCRFRVYEVSVFFEI